MFEAGGHTLLCMSTFPLSLTLSLRIWRGNFGLLYHLDWKQIVPAQFGPPLDASTVICEGKYARNLLSFHSAAVFFWISRLGSVRLLAGKDFAVRRVYSVVPSSPWTFSLWLSCYLLPTYLALLGTVISRIRQSRIPGMMSVLVSVVVI